MSKAAQQTAKQQSVREKFFLDFASATAQSSDPFRSQRKSQTIAWLPEVLVIDDQPVEAVRQEIDQSILELQALFSLANTEYLARQ